MKLAKLLLILLFPGASVACLNESGTTIEGETRTIFRHTAASLEKTRSQSAAERYTEIHWRSSRQTDEPFAKEESRGIELVLNGRYPKALEVFQKIESDHPGQYSTAANLGTTYELLGELESASKWIAEGIRRNSNSHRGTEWLHLAILDAKIKLKEDPSYLTRTHIISVPDNVTPYSQIEVAGKGYPVMGVFNALEYQLHERLFFVRTADPVVADLLFSFGQLEAKIWTLESAIDLLEMAKAYEYPDRSGLDATIHAYKTIVRIQRLKKTALIAAGVLPAVFFLIYAYKKKWFFLSMQDYKKHLEMKKLQEGVTSSGAA